MSLLELIRYDGGSPSSYSPSLPLPVPWNPIRSGHHDHDHTTRGKTGGGGGRTVDGHVLQLGDSKVGDDSRGDKGSQGSGEL